MDDAPSPDELAILDWVAAGNRLGRRTSLGALWQLQAIDPLGFLAALAVAPPGDLQALTEAMRERGAAVPDVAPPSPPRTLPRRQPWQPFDAAQRACFVELVREGRSRTVACRALGLHRRTVHTWTQRGHDDAAHGRESPHRAFVAALLEAEAARPLRWLAS